MIPDLVVCTSVDGDVLSGVVVDPSVELTDASFAFYLIKDGEVVWRSRYSSSDRIFCRLEHAGTYELKAFVKNDDFKNSYKSAPVDYVETPKRSTFGAQFSSKGFDEFIAEDVNRLPSLPFAPLEYPHQDFVILSTIHGEVADIRNTLQTGFAEGTLHYSGWATSNGDVLHVASRQKVSQRQDESYLFSGMTRTRERFIFGMDDLAETPLEDVVDQVGDSVLVHFNDHGVRVSSDYFGIGQVYYYSKDGVICVANRYQLLLLVLKSMDIELKINSRKAVGNLSALSQPFMQNFTREMEVNDCFSLTVGEVLEISDGCLHITKSDITAVLESDQSLSEDDYSALVQDSKEEIIDNLKVVLKHPRFKAVRVDVTGGMDARMVFAALSQLPEYRNKVHIHTADMQGSPEDLQISLALTELYDFKYDEISRTSRAVGLWDTFLGLLSLDLGTYYGRKPVSAVSKLDDTIRVNGFYGEICARPYYARSLFDKNYENKSTKLFSKTYISRINKKLSPIGQNVDFIKIFEDELSKIPGRDVLEKFDHHYLFYRNGLHCTDRWLTQTLAPGWGPLQSKQMFKLKHSTFVESKNIKVQLDVTDAINDCVSRVPYGREKDNDERAKLAPYLLRKDLAEVEMPVAKDDSRHRAAITKRAALTKQLPRPDAHLIQTANQNFYEMLRYWTLNAVRSILQDGRVLSRPQGEQLYHTVVDRFEAEGERPDDKTLVLINKIFSLYYQLDLVS